MRLILTGDPYLALRATKGQSIWTDAHMTKVKYLRLIEDASSQQIHGPVHADIIFYMKPNEYTPRFSYHQALPIMSELIRMIELLITGELISSRASLASVSASKIYDDEPRVDITITSLKRKR
jgi:Holliday junction resolvase RusA-like endonuclease